MDAGGIHLGNEVLGSIDRDLAVTVARHLDGLRPDMDLGVDDFHANL